MKKEAQKGSFNLPILDCVLFAVRYCVLDKEKDLIFRGDSWCGSLAFKVRNWELFLKHLRAKADFFCENEKLNQLVHFVEEKQGDFITKKAVCKNVKTRILLNEDDYYLFAKAPPEDLNAPQMECMEVHGLIGGKESSALVYNFDIELMLETFVPECFCEQWDLRIQEELGKINKCLQSVIKEHSESVLFFDETRRVYGFDASVNILGANMSFIDAQITALNERSHLNVIINSKNSENKIEKRL